ncbi:hypothetical protein Ddc_05786 [Ditylenchus destructor]|nr:hypothetical protein Ddc_05786 [Ditylenchus destructor]
MSTAIMQIVMPRPTRFSGGRHQKNITLAPSTVVGGIGAGSRDGVDFNLLGTLDRASPCSTARKQVLVGNDEAGAQKQK